MVRSSGGRRFGVAVVAVGVAVLLAACSPTASEGEEEPAAVSSTSSATASEAASSSTSSDRSGSASTTREAKGGQEDKGQQAAKDDDRKKPSSTTKTSSTKRYRVIRVVDGDTVEVDINGGESVRVIGIDTPETVDPDEPTECGGPEATEAAQEMLNGKSVAVVFDESQGRRETYGRLLAYLELPGTGDFGEQMLRAGHAEEYTYGTAYERQSTYRSAEEHARTAGDGLWGGCAQEQEPSQSPEPAPTPSSTPAPEPTQTPAPEPAEPPAAGPADQESAPGPGWTNDSLTPGYTGCRQGYPGGKINGVYWWKAISC